MKSSILTYVTPLCLLLSINSAPAAERQLPDAAKAILDAADAVTAYSLEPAWLKETTKETFHGWIVRGKAEVKDVESRKALLRGMERLITNPGKGGARCFKPRHAIRAAHDGKFADFVICFECGWVDIYVEGKGEVDLIEIDMESGDHVKLLELFAELLPKEPGRQSDRLVLENEYSTRQETDYSVRPVECVDISPDGSQLLVGSRGWRDSTTELLDAKELKLKRRFPFGSTHVSFAGDGKQFLRSYWESAAEDEDHGVKLVDADTGAIVKTIEKADEIFSFDKKQNLLVWGGRDCVVIYDLAKNTVMHRWEGEGDDFPSVHCVSQSGVVAFHARYKAEKLLFPPYDQTPIDLSLSFLVGKLHLSPDSKVAALTNAAESLNGRVELWDVATKRKLRELDEHSAASNKVLRLAFSPDGVYLASLAGANSRDEPEVIVWATKSFKEVGRVVAHQGTANSLAWFPDSERFATGGSDGSIKVWRIQDGLRNTP